MEEDQIIILDKSITELADYSKFQELATILKRVYIKHRVNFTSLKFIIRQFPLDYLLYTNPEIVIFDRQVDNSDASEFLYKDINSVLNRTGFIQLYREGNIITFNYK
jgi:hypothetical protein